MTWGHPFHLCMLCVRLPLLKAYCACVKAIELGHKGIGLFFGADNLRQPIRTRTGLRLRLNTRPTMLFGEPNVLLDFLHNIFIHKHLCRKINAYYIIDLYSQSFHKPITFFEQTIFYDEVILNGYLCEEYRFIVLAGLQHSGNKDAGGESYIFFNKHMMNTAGYRFGLAP